MRKDGSPMAVLLSATAVKDGEGRFLMSRSTMIDNTARKQMETALRASEERFALAMEGANDGLWDWNVGTNDMYCSPRWKSMLGYEDGELENDLRTWERLVHPDDVDRVRDDVRAYLEGRSAKYESEYRMRHKAGHYADILARAFAVRRGSDARPLRLVGTHVDITERKRTAQETAGRQGRRRGGQSRQERVPGQHVPRDPHPDERHPRILPTDAARPGPDVRATATPRHHQPQRRAPARSHQRHPGVVQNRGRPRTP